MRIHKAVLVRASLAAFTVFLFMFIGWVPEVMTAGLAAEPASQVKEPLHLKVVLERNYLDGEVSEEVVEEKVYSLENFWSKYDQWKLKKINESQVVFSRQVDDISPLLKANGYFGITDKGVLTIFNGKPGHSRIIQSFFQIDIKKLESRKQAELIHGIPIKTKDHYVEVLETFKPYSTDGK